MWERGIFGVLLALAVGCGGDGSSSTGALSDAGVEAGDGAASIDQDDDGYPQSEDCDDTDPDVNPGADEVCNGIDDDCNDRVDDGAVDATTWYQDADGDGYGDDGIFTEACEKPAGFVDRAGDCKDGDRAYNPGAGENDCSDPNDYNCDGSVGYEDADQDGYPACQDCKDDVYAIHPNATEVCDFADNDCDPTTVDGSAEPWFGDPCDGADDDLCEEGTYGCPNGRQVCSDNTGSNVETCDGNDNDCNPATPDGSGEATLGNACDGPDADACLEGTYVCSGGSLKCEDNTGDALDVCDGVDNDCDPSTPDGSADSRFGTPCDGADADLCEEGTWECNNRVMRCNDTSGDTPDLCNGSDDDCDSSTPDGFGETGYGTACDGPDADLCEEGTWQCNGVSMSCSDTSGDTPDLCNGSDDDCNPDTPDGMGEAWFYTSCDGADSDNCDEGVNICDTSAQSCTDTSGNTVSACPLFDPLVSCMADANVTLGQSVLVVGYAGDPDGGAVSYAWSVTASPSGSTAAPASATSAQTPFVPDQAGSYALELCATDDEGARACCTTTLTAS